MIMRKVRLVSSGPKNSLPQSLTAYSDAMKPNAVKTPPTTSPLSRLMNRNSVSSWGSRGMSLSVMAKILVNRANTIDWKPMKIAAAQ